MASLVTFQLVGARDLEAKLERASLEVRRRCERICQDTALRIKNRAQSLAPRDKGDLVRAIAAQGRGLNWRVGILDVRIPSRGGQSSHQHPWVYGVWYEYGFVTRNIPAHPFMRPAADAEEERHYNEMSQAVNEAIDQVAA